jgi:hypothetical protein
MTSAISWLDFSEEDQRSAREILQLFTQPGSVDELGIGPVRDALSDAMFPGTSVLHTRARYLLFIPWLFAEGARLRPAGAPLLGWVDHQERRLIEALRRGGFGDAGHGLIGRNAGASLKHLPSSIYWHALQEWQILTRPGTIEQIAGAPQRTHSVEAALTEFVEHDDAVWDPNLPKPPESFFQMEGAAFSLEAEEAEWLAERIEKSVPGTLLEWLVASNIAPKATSGAPWEDSSVSPAPAELSRVLSHAHLFSAVLHGAALLYKLIVAERCAELGLTHTSEKVADYKSRLEVWATGLGGLGHRLTTWPIDQFWGLVMSANPGIPLLTRSFIDKWIALVLPSEGRSVANNEVARQLIGSRERQLKGGRSRLTNDRLLHEWTGSSGADPLTFRWQQVKVLVTDISAGRSARASA